MLNPLPRLKFVLVLLLATRISKGTLLRSGLLTLGRSCISTACVPSQQASFYPLPCRADAEYPCVLPSPDHGIFAESSSLDVGDR